MRKVAAAGAIAGMLFAASAAAARDHWVAIPKRTPHHAHPVRTLSPCPFDGPEQMFTIVNAGVTGVTLSQIAAIEQATRDESFAVRMYYGTACARFGSGGLPIYLSNGYEALPGGGYTYQLGGYHTPSGIYVQTGLLPYTTWVRAFTHEVMEYLVDPTGTRWFGNYQAEISDPVENWTYEVDQLQVSDFVTPNWFSDGPGPWDAARRLTGPS